MKGLPSASIDSEATKSRAKVRKGSEPVLVMVSSEATYLFISRVSPMDRSDSTFAYLCVRPGSNSELVID
jgi:hypothetical protein